MWKLECKKREANNGASVKEELQSQEIRKCGKCLPKQLDCVYVCVCVCVSVGFVSVRLCVCLFSNTW